MASEDEKLAELKSAHCWALMDHFVTAEGGADLHSPWSMEHGRLKYSPDYGTLVRLLQVPLYYDATTTSRIPARAVDVWVAHELRRAGFDPDAVWPRASAPRVVPMPVLRFLQGLNANQDERALRARLEERLRTKPPTGAGAASASVLGKAYAKQVDVMMTDWSTGPEILISTKRMDRSFSNNAANRVEESYGDAKNLRQRHPLAALGFVYALNYDAFKKRDYATAIRITDLLGKLGREDDAYHSVLLLVVRQQKHTPSDGEPEPEPLSPGVAGAIPEADLATEPIDSASHVPVADEIPLPEAATGGRSKKKPLDPVIKARLQRDPMGVSESELPEVQIMHEKSPEHLGAPRFFETMIRRVLEVTPVEHHSGAREQLRRLVGDTYEELMLAKQEFESWE